MTKRPLGHCVMRPCEQPPAFSFLGTRDDWGTAQRLTYGDGEWIRGCIEHTPEAMRRFTELPDGPSSVHADPINGGTTFAITDDEDQGDGHPHYQPIPSPGDSIEPNRAERRRFERGHPADHRTPIRSHRNRNRRAW